MNPIASHPKGYVKGCQCERCEKARARSREYAKTYKHPDPAERRRYKTAKQNVYAADPAKKTRDRAWRAAHPDAVWAHSLKKTHGLSAEQWYAMWMEQSGNCYLCEQPLPDDRSKVYVEHDHSHCGKDRSCGTCRRGLAHQGCNSAIGFAGEDPAVLRRIADNLERQQSITQALIIASPRQEELF